MNNKKEMLILKRHYLEKGKNEVETGEAGFIEDGKANGDDKKKKNPKPSSIHFVSRGVASGTSPPYPSFSSPGIGVIA